MKKEDIHFIKQIASITGDIYTFAVSSSRIWGDNFIDRQTEEEEYEFQENLKSYRTDSCSIAPAQIFKVEHGLFYQLMPEGQDEGFFDWYCWVREEYQEFDSKEMCVTFFLKYWNEWIKQGKPSWETSKRWLKI